MHVNSNNYIKFKGILLTSMHCFICGEKISSHERKNWLFCTKCEQQLQPENRAKLNRLKWLAILIVPYLQAVMYYGSKYREMKQLENSAGEIEQDRTSKRANLIEVLLLYGLAQFAMWFLIGYGGMGLNSQLLNILGYLIFSFGYYLGCILIPVLSCRHLAWNRFRSSYGIIHNI